MNMTASLPSTARGKLNCDPLQKIAHLGGDAKSESPPCVANEDDPNECAKTFASNVSRRSIAYEPDPLAALKARKLRDQKSNSDKSGRTSQRGRSHHVASEAIYPC
jgi:hypothetical protein